MNDNVERRQKTESRIEIASLVASAIVPDDPSSVSVPLLSGLQGLSLDIGVGCMVVVRETNVGSCLVGSEVGSAVVDLGCSLGSGSPLFRLFE